jgi:hypothetical protein
MHLIDLASNLWYSDLLETDDTTVTKILEWLKNHIGDLNNLIATNYHIIGNDTDIELGNDEASIFGMIYLMNYYQRQQKVNLGASAYDWSEVVEADTRVRRVSRNEIAKNYRLLANDLRDNMNKMVEYYKKFKCIPASIHTTFFTSLVQQIQQPGSCDDQ